MDDAHTTAPEFEQHGALDNYKEALVTARSTIDIWAAK